MKIASFAAGALTATILTGAVAANAGVESTHEVPEWMNRVCKSEDSVNCWYDGGRYGHTGPIFVRQVPGRAKMVCVYYADKPRRDYCEKTR